MVKFLKFLSVLFLAFILMNILYLFVLPRVDWDFAKAKEAYRFKNKNIKLLVFGNSTAMDGINSEMLSKQFGESYNFSIGGATLQSNYLQLKQYLQRNTTPEKVLLFLSSAHLNYRKENVLNPIVEHYYADATFKFDLKEIPLFKFRWLFVENIKKLLSSEHRSAKLVQGQLRISKIIPDNSIANQQIVHCRDQAFYTEDGYEYMWQIAALCKEKNVKLLVFEMPCWKDAQDNCADVKLTKQVNNTPCSFTIRNLNTVQLCDTMLDAKNDWLSRNHLNYNGSVKVTRVISKIVEQ